jgi:uncharacterized protein
MTMSKQLTVLAVADEISPLLYDYFDRERWRHIDLVLSCGDLPPEYLGFLCSSLDVPVLYVRGNHDSAYQMERYDGCINVHGRVVECNGVRVAGFEGSQRYNAGPVQYTEGMMQRLLWRERLRCFRSGGPDIVLTHAPPAGVHDAPDLCHRGFASFVRAIECWRPQYFVHGHTHAYNRSDMTTTVGHTTVVNAYPYTVLRIEPGDPPEHASRSTGRREA